MSFKALLKHRATIKRLTLTQVDGLSTQQWNSIATGVQCFLDLTYIRMGKDPVWTPEAGRPNERTGVIFMLAKATVRSGDRIEITRGPAGIFSIEGAADSVWTPDQFHHYELGVREVGSALAKDYPIEPIPGVVSVDNNNDGTFTLSGEGVTATGDPHEWEVSGPNVTETGDPHTYSISY